MSPDDARARPAAWMWIAHVLTAFVPVVPWIVGIVCLRRLPLEARPLSFRAGVAVDGVVCALLVVGAATGAFEGAPLRLEQIGMQERASLGILGDSESSPRGALVTAVLPDSAAARAGMRVGDRIEAVDGTSTPSLKAVRTKLERLAPGQACKLAVARGEQALALSVELGHTLGPSARTVTFRVWLRWLLLGGSMVLVLGLAWRAHRSDTRGALSVLGGLLLALVAMSVPASFQLAGLIAPRTASELLLYGGGLMLPVAIALWLRHDRRGGPVLEPHLGTVGAYARGLGLTFGWVLRAYWLLAMLAVVFNVNMGPTEAYAQTFGASTPAERSRLLIAAALFAPVAEELLFRGALLDWLCRFLAPWWAIALSATLFAAVHVHSHGAGVLHVVAYGVVFGWMRCATGSIQAGMLLHATINALLVALMMRG